MKKTMQFVWALMILLTSACGVNSSMETDVPTQTTVPAIRFLTPQDGATLDQYDMYFQVDPVPGAEGYAWSFIQNGVVLWETIRDEQKLTGTDYRVPNIVNAYKKIVPGELQVQARARINGVWTEPSTITVYLTERVLADAPTSPPPSTPKPTKSPPTPKVTVPPEPVSIPTAPTGWNTYVNDYFGYQFSYPSSMKIHTEGFMGMETNQLIPPGFTFDEYFTYLENIFPDNLCVMVESDAGLIAIAPPGDSIGRFADICPGMGIGEQYRFEDTSQTFLVNGEQLRVNGTQLYLQSTGELDSEFFMFNLKNGFRITFISGPAKGQPLESYPEKMDLLKQVLSTLTWTRVPDLTIPGTTCAGKYTRLLVGVWAQVAPGDPNRVRSAPSKSAEVIGQLYPGTASLILEGPVCADGLVYWKVENSTIPGGSGWTAEGDGEDYWLGPYE